MHSTYRCIFDKISQRLDYDHKEFYDSSYIKIILESMSCKFAVVGVEEDDPELIKFVQKLIKPPSNIKYNFTNPNKPNSDYSQEG